MKVGVRIWKNMLRNEKNLMEKNREEEMNERKIVEGRRKKRSKLRINDKLREDMEGMEGKIVKRKRIKRKKKKRCRIDDEIEDWSLRW